MTNIETEEQRDNLVKKIKTAYDETWQKLLSLLKKIDLKKCLVFFSLFYSKLHMIPYRNWRAQICDKINRLLLSFTLYDPIPQELATIRYTLGEGEDICLFVLEFIGRLEENSNKRLMLNLNQIQEIIEYVREIFKCFNEINIISTQKLPLEYIIGCGIKIQSTELTPSDKLIIRHGRYRFRELDNTESIGLSQFYHDRENLYSVFNEKGIFKQRYGFSTIELIQYMRCLTEISSEIEKALSNRLKKLKKIFKVNWLQLPKIDPLELFNDKFATNENVVRLNHEFLLFEINLLLKITQFKFFTDFFIETSVLKKKIAFLTKLNTLITDKIYNQLIFNPTEKHKVGYLSIYQHPLLKFENSILLIPNLYLTSLDQIMDRLISSSGDIGRLKGDLLQIELKKAVKTLGFKILFEKSHFFDENHKHLFEMDMGIEENNHLILVECKMMPFAELDPELYYNYQLKESKLHRWIRKLERNLGHLQKEKLYLSKDQVPKEFIAEIHPKSYDKIYAILITDKPIYYDDKKIPKSIKIRAVSEFLEEYRTSMNVK